MLPKVLITNRVHDDVISFLKPHCRLVVNGSVEPWSCEQVAREAHDATGIIAFMSDCIDNDFLSRCPDLRIVASVLKGYDNFDIAACTRRGVWFSVVGDGLTAATAELTIGLLIGISRHIVPADAYVRRAYQGWRPIFYGTGIENKTIGILGMGAIGQAIAKRLRGFDCQVTYFDESPLPPARAAALGAQSKSFDEVLSASDYLIIALPLNQRSKHLINAASISSMKSGSYIINPARGSIVDEEAMADALQAGHLAGYATDVYEMEDWARTDRPKAICARLLADNERTILTPHLGSADAQARYQAEMQMAHSVVDYLEGRVPRGAINNPNASKAMAAC